MLTKVDGTCEPFSDQWLDQLDKMSNEDALVWVKAHIDSVSRCKLALAEKFLDCPDNELQGVIHAWCVDSNNMVRLSKLYREIKGE